MITLLVLLFVCFVVKKLVESPKKKKGCPCSTCSCKRMKEVGMDEQQMDSTLEEE